jgi:hypothetical protein
MSDQQNNHEKEKNTKVKNACSGGGCLKKHYRRSAKCCK